MKKELMNRRFTAVVQMLMEELLLEIKLLVPILSLPLVPFVLGPAFCFDPCIELLVIGFCPRPQIVL
jgi:hypothetical protein